MASAASTDPAPRRVRQADLARELKVSRQAIGDLVARGILVLGEDKMLDYAAAVAALDQVRPGSKTTEALPAAIAPTPAPPGTTPAPTPGPAPVFEDMATSFHVARTLNEAAQAAMNQLKLREMQGELIRVDAVQAVWATALASTREHLTQVRARLAPLLAIESDAFKIDQLLDAEMSQALQHLANADVATPKSAAA